MRPRPLRISTRAVAARLQAEHIPPLGLMPLGRARARKEVGVPKAFPSGEGGSRRLTDEVGEAVGAAD